MEKQVEFKVGNETLRGTLFMPQGKGPFPGVIFFHGSGGVGEMYLDFAEAVSKVGIVGLAFNYRGAGASEGNFEDQTIEMGLADAKAAIDYFISLNEVDKDKIGLVGGSFGGFLASTLANSRNFNSIVLIGPAAYSAKAYQTQRDFDEDLRDGFEESLSYKEIENFKGSLLVALSELEDVLPEGMAEKYFDTSKSSKKEKYIIKGANHRISINPEAKLELQKKIINWLRENL